MDKIFVLDTNVILIDPTAIFKFGKNQVFIPLVVVEEVDRFKKDQNENGRNARHFSRLVDELRKQGPLSEGVTLDNKGTLIISVDLEAKHRPKHFDLSINDNKILASALALKEQGRNIVLVTKDINLRLKSDILEVQAEDYGKKDTSLEELYSGYRTFDVSGADLSTFDKDRFLDLPEAIELGIWPNEYLIVQEEGNDRRRSLGRYCKRKKGIVPLIPMREGVWGIYPKNMEQQFALDALLNDEIALVSLVGKAGTGKTLLAIAAGLEKTISNSKYSRLLVSRPIQPMGKDLGYLPGDVNDKLGPWMQPIFDNMDFLFGQTQKGSDSNTSSYEDLINQGLLHIEPLTYIRGRSIPGQYLIVDEAQNLSPHEVKTIITRAGEGTKIVFTGDVHQIDSPYLDTKSNGLSYLTDKMKGQAVFAHVNLVHGERSELAELASNLL